MSDDLYEFFQNYFDEGYELLDDGDFWGCWRDPNGEIIEPDHPMSPPSLEGLI